MCAFFRISVIAMLALLAAGCSSFWFVGKGGKQLDIQQRVVLSNQFGDEKQNRMCAEPSPDAMSSLAGQLSASGDTPGKTSAELAAAFQQSAAFVGVRSQSIQLLRDAQYRLCEAYMNGAMDSQQYGVLLRRYQRQMITLLAIEQLTGTVRAPAVAISSEGFSSTARALPEIKAEMDRVDADLATQEAALAAATDAAEKAKLTKKIADLKDYKGKLDKVLEAGASRVASGKSDVTIVQQGGGLTVSSGDVVAIAKIVQEMVSQINDTDDLGPLCTAYLIAGKDLPLGIAGPCTTYLTAAASRASNVAAAVATANQQSIEACARKPDGKYVDEASCKAAQQHLQDAAKAAGNVLNIKSFKGLEMLLE